MTDRDTPRRPTNPRLAIAVAALTAITALPLLLGPTEVRARDPLWDDLPWRERVGPEWFRINAARGDAQAQYRLALLHERGVEVERDRDTAAKWYRRAAEQGHARAQFKLASYYRQGRLNGVDLAEAKRWYAQAADQGLARAQYNLGVLVQRGIGGTPDPGRAAELYREAAAGGVAAAHMSLGLLYTAGEGMARDPVTALAHLIRAAEADVPGAGQARRKVARDLGQAERKAAAARAADLAPGRPQPPAVGE
jgi:TPR repeat protein